MSKNKTTHELFEDWQLAEVHQPAAEESARLEEITDAPEENLLMGSETILLVDDEDIIIDVARDMLEILGYRVIVAQNGQDAIDIYARQKEGIDMVIQDMVMPGLNGADVFRALKMINPAVKVIFLSGYSENMIDLEEAQYGDVHFLQKPVLPSNILKKVREVLDN